MKTIPGHGDGLVPGRRAAAARPRSGYSPPPKLNEESIVSGDAPEGQGVCADAPPELWDDFSELDVAMSQKLPGEEAADSDAVDCDAEPFTDGDPQATIFMRRMKRKPHGRHSPLGAGYRQRYGIVNARSRIHCLRRPLYCGSCWPARTRRSGFY